MSSRDRHLFGPGPKRMLTLDGGGVRGAISIGFLEQLETLIEEIEGRPILLCDWFDFIGGTSTGAIIAGALALGYRAADVRKFYNTLAPRVFRRSFWRVAGFMSKLPGRQTDARYLDRWNPSSGDVGRADAGRRPAVVRVPGMRSTLPACVPAGHDRLQAMSRSSACGSPPAAPDARRWPVERLRRKLGNCDVRPFAPLPARRRGRSRAYHDKLVAQIRAEERS